jgi:uncharacterized protein (DUF885 family)
MPSRRELLGSATALLALGGCASMPSSMTASGASTQSGPPPPGPADELNRLLDDSFDQLLADSPQEATALGLDKGPRAAAKSKLDDASAAQVAHLRAQVAARLERFKAIDRAALTGMAAVNYDSVRFTTEDDAANARFGYGDVGAGSPYVLSQLTGAYQSIPDFLGTQHVIETEADADAYLSRLAAFAGVMDQEAERARADAARGVVPPDFAVDGALAQMKGLIEAPDRSPLVTSVADRARASGIAGDYRAQAGAIYAQKVVPALNRQIALMTGLRGRATHDAGCWKLPDGEAYYALSLHVATTTTLGAEEIHQMGLDQARELSARADVLLKKQGMSQGGVGARIRALLAEPRYRYPNTDAGKEKLIVDLNAQVRAMQARLPAWFGALPKAPVEIRRVPRYTEAGAPGGYYNSPSLDGSRPGIYWINLRDTAETPGWTLPTLTYHEAIPGHHLQLSLQQEADLPMIRRATFFSAYGEGWALYAEQLAQEMGVYADDPLGEIGYLQSALFRAARLVVDTGLHAKRWSREQAIATMTEIDGELASTAATEIERYSVWPGQACSYMVGKLTWLRLRERAKAALGAKFDIRQFHDAGLLGGCMPLTVLDRVIDDYIAARQAVA